MPLPCAPHAPPPSEHGEVHAQCQGTALGGRRWPGILGSFPWAQPDRGRNGRLTSNTFFLPRDCAWVLARDSSQSSGGGDGCPGDPGGPLSRVTHASLLGGGGGRTTTHARQRPLYRPIHLAIRTNALPARPTRSPPGSPAALRTPRAGADARARPQMGGRRSSTPQKTHPRHILAPRAGPPAVSRVGTRGRSRRWSPGRPRPGRLSPSRRWDHENERQRARKGRADPQRVSGRFSTPGGTTRRLYLDI